MSALLVTWVIVRSGRASSQACTAPRRIDSAAWSLPATEYVSTPWASLRPPGPGHDPGRHPAPDEAAGEVAGEEGDPAEAAGEGGLVGGGVEGGPVEDDVVGRHRPGLDVRRPGRHHHSGAEVAAAREQVEHLGPRGAERA